MEINNKKLIPTLSILVVILSLMLIALSGPITQHAPANQIQEAKGMVEIDETNLVSIAEGTHDLGKSVVRGDTRWIEMRAGVNKEKDFMGYYEGLYELWRAHGSESPKLVSTFSLSNFSAFEWGINQQDGVTVTHWDGGPEGGTSTKIIYDAQGEERARVTQEDLPADGDTFTFAVNPTYTIRYLLKEDCGGEQTKEVLTKNVELQGISISYGRDRKHDYLMSKPALLECMPYDSTFINPTIKIVSFDEKSVSVQLTDDIGATITKGIPPEVTFQ